VPKVLNYLLENSAINFFGVKCVKRVGFARYRNVLRDWIPFNIIPMPITNIL